MSRIMRNTNTSDFQEISAHRASADRLETQGKRVLALLFRNAAFCLETGQPYFDDVQIRRQEKQ
jgi:hypothetical protein